MAIKFDLESAHLQQPRAPRNSESAALTDNWGIRWASVAAAAGAQAAAGSPLPVEDEVEARRFALSFTVFSPEMRAYARVHADGLTTLAVDLFRAARPALEAAENATSPLGHEGETLMGKAEHWGRAAARVHRTLALLAELEGAQ
ncbi:hypothetical protein [Phenylobacterium sp.]|uniref:hypothetical protein n=1 Tax=Phenylobacterium sp. TaxID=1871053 RepID=UPI0035AF5C68